LFFSQTLSLLLCLLFVVSLSEFSFFIILYNLSYYHLFFEIDEGFELLCMCVSVCFFFFRASSWKNLF
jgi:hypothetical protein